MTMPTMTPKTFQQMTPETIELLTSIENTAMSTVP